MRRAVSTALAVLALGAAPGVALAAPGDVYLADPNADGDPTFFAGVHRVPEDGSAATRVTAPGTLATGSGIALLDAATAVTVGYQSVDRVDLATGAVTNVATGTGLGALAAVAVEETGSLVATGAATEGAQEPRVLRIDPADGSFDVVASGGQLVAPDGVVVDRDGVLYVADPAGAAPGKVLRIDPLTGAQTVVSTGGLSDPFDLALLPDGDLLVIDETYGQYRGALVRIDPVSGAQEPTYFDGDVAGGAVGRPFGLALDDLGRAIVALREEAGIERIDLRTGQATLLSDAGLVAPAHLALAPSTTGPQTVVTGAPPATTDDPTPAIAFTSTRYDSAASCAVDGGTPVDCASPFTPAALPDGVHEVTVRSRFSGVEGPPAVVRFRVRTGRPVALARPAVSGLPTAGATLTTDDGTWGGPPATYAVGWQRCTTTSACTTLTTPDATDGDRTYTVTPADTGGRLRSVITADDGTTTAFARSLLGRRIGLPVPTARPVLDGGLEHTVDEVLTTGDGAWEGAPTGYAVAWEACDEDGHGCARLTRADAIDGDHELTVTLADRGTRIRSLVTATNAAGSRRYGSRLGPAVGRPTRVLPPRVTPDAPSDGSTVTLADGTWRGTPFAFFRGWVRCDAEGRACVPITTPDATDGDATYDVTAADVGATLRGVVTARNPFGDARAFSPATAVVP